MAGLVTPLGDNKGFSRINNDQYDVQYSTESWSVNLVTGHTYPLGYGWSWRPHMNFNHFTVKTQDYISSNRELNQMFFSETQLDDAKHEIVEIGGGF